MTFSTAKKLCKPDIRQFIEIKKKIGRKVQFHNIQGTITEVVLEMTVKSTFDCLSVTY